MGKTSVPKQFLSINDKPIIIHTLEKILSMDHIDKTVIICNEKYCDYLRDILNDYGLSDKVCITKGGDTRLDSVLSGINFVKENFKVSDDDIFVAHDAVRPFVSSRIINENIAEAKKHDGATTVMSLVETIVETNDDGLYKAYPRSNLYTGQSPQTFKINYYLDNVSKVPQDIRNNFTDLSECVMYNGNKVFPVMGERENIKITTPIDLIIAKDLLNNKDNL